LKLGLDALYPGHGPELVGEAPESVINYYLAHRVFRESQVISILALGPKNLDEIVDSIYSGLRDDLKNAARQSTRTCLDKLKKDEKIEEFPAGVWAISN
jgi:hypothetical protein